MYSQQHEFLVCNIFFHNFYKGFLKNLAGALFHDTKFISHRSTHFTQTTPTRLIVNKH